MTTTSSVSNAHRIKFHDDMIVLAQQSVSLFENCVRDEPDYLEGKFGYFDRLGSIEAVERTRRLQPTVLQNIAHSRRRISLRDFDINVPIDATDVRRMKRGDMLKSKYLSQSVAGMKRKKDALILAAILGDAYSVDENDVATAVPLPSAQKIVNGGTNLNLDKILEGKERLLAADVDLDQETIEAAISPKAFTAMQGITEFKSSDFASERGLEMDLNGRKFRWLQINWTITNQLSLSGNIRSCAMWAQSGVGVAKGQEIDGDIKQLPQFNWTECAHTEFAFDATRIEDEKVIQIDIDESA